MGILNTHGSSTIDAGKKIADSLNAINEILSHRIRSAATHSKFAAEIESSLKKCMQMAQPRVLKKKTAAPASDDSNYPMVKRKTTRMKIPTSKPYAMPPAPINEPPKQATVTVSKMPFRPNALEHLSKSKSTAPSMPSIDDDDSEQDNIASIQPSHNLCN